MTAMRVLPVLVSAAAVGLTAAGCGGKTKTATVTTTQTVVRTVTAPPASTPSSAPAATPTAPSTAPAGPRSCGRIDITYPNGEGGSTALGIVATGLSCGEARAVTRTCQRGNVTPGWRARLAGGSAFVMTSGAKRVTFRLAGGGGCAS